MGRAQGTRAQMALAFETTYGTTPGSGFFLQPFTSSDLGATRPLLESEVVGNGRDPIDPDLDVQTVNGTVEVPVDTEAFGNWLKLLFGDPSTSGSAPYTHVFTSAGTSLPSASIEIGKPEVPDYAMNVGVMADTLELDWARSGQLRARLGLIGQGEDAPASSSSAGTPTEFDYYRFANRHGSITRGGSDLGNVTGATFRYANNLDPVETVRDDGLLEGIDPSMAMLGGQMTLRHATTALIDDAIAHTPAAMTFELARSASQSLVFTVPRVFLSKPKVGVQGPRGIDVSYDWVAAQQTDGNPMLTATLINAVDGY